LHQDAQDAIGYGTSADDPDPDLVGTADCEDASVEGENAQLGEDLLQDPKLLADKDNLQSDPWLALREAVEQVEKFVG
jgi:hypothetical protein